MELTKFSTGGEILAHIKHDVRQIPEGKSYGNESVDRELSKTNYSLIDRGKTATEINQYRKDFEKECFKYNRKNLVHSVELVIQCPSDCPQEQHEQFFQTAFDWYCDRYLPAGKDCVFVAEVHRDEHKFITAYENGKELQKDISKEHLHIMYVPAVPAGEKHPEYKYRLNADQLTKRAVLRDMHPSLQKELKEKGIQGTVYSKKSSDGKTIGLSVKQLKEITEKYGITIDHSITVDELAQIIGKNAELTEKVDALSSSVTEKNKNISELTKTLSFRDHQLEALRNDLQTKSTDLSSDKEVAELKSKLQEKEVENAKIKATATQIITEKELENQKLQEQLQTIKEQLQERDLELQKSKDRIADLETSKDKTWGSDAGWGSKSGWGNTSAWNTNNNNTYEEEKTW